MLKIGIVAGEYSGDLLGAGLVRELKQNLDNIRVEGILGPELIAAGGTSLFPIHKLAVMGISELFRKYFDLASIRNQLKCHFLSNPPDVFIGIDAPDFNIPLEIQLRRAGIKTVHYVSPSIWAWRTNRIDNIVSAADLMLMLYPFEQKYYKNKSIRAEYVGHPLADRLPDKPDVNRARDELSLDRHSKYICLMPGSRDNELKNHLPIFTETAKWCYQSCPGMKFLCCFQNQEQFDQYSASLHARMRGMPLHVYTGDSLRVMEAADVILLASGTVALEAMLLKKPMVATYRTNKITYMILKNMVKIPHVSLPNILFGDQIVPEFLQDEMTPEHMGQAILQWLDNPSGVKYIEAEFSRLHRMLRNQADAKAASAVMRLCHVD
jgi:lipid-A-disaccharide synthase